jgi:regulator of protease activity HflC (stomatin/prohibitin superfamily)
MSAVFLMLDLNTYTACFLQLGFLPAACLAFFRQVRAEREAAAAVKEEEKRKREEAKAAAAERMKAKLEGKKGGKKGGKK